MFCVWMIQIQNHAKPTTLNSVCLPMLTSCFSDQAFSNYLLTNLLLYPKFYWFLVTYTGSSSSYTSISKTCLIYYFIYYFGSFLYSDYFSDLEFSLIQFPVLGVAILDKSKNSSLPGSSNFPNPKTLWYANEVGESLNANSYGRHHFSLTESNTSIIIS